MGGKQSKTPNSSKKQLPQRSNTTGCPVVQTKFGALRGASTYTKQSGQAVYNYLGIPYAAPPVGERRFCAPAPPQPWNKIRDATVPGPPCSQPLPEATKSFHPVPIPDQVPSEDCLYLNIYTTGVGPLRKPVMVWIHGGSFNKGMGQLYDGTAYAMYGDVVVVTVGYRLGVIGFLSTEDAKCPGNFGFLDQVAALRWVQQHIEHFGGDPSNVTLFGESAGAISTQLMLLSPLTQGLFHRVISQSGSAGVRSAWSINIKEKTRMLAKLLGCNAADSRGIVSFLRQIHIDKIIEAQTKLKAKGITFVLTIGGEFLNRQPTDLYSLGLFHKVPHIVGFNTNEGYYFCSSLCPEFEEKTVTEDKCLHFIHRFLSVIYPGNEDRVLDVVRKEYFPQKEKEARSRDLSLLRKTCADALGDLLLTGPVYQSAEFHCMSAPTYVYLYDHRPSYTRFPANIQGATHEEELLFTWGDPWMDRPVNSVVSYTAEERQLSLKLIKYWTNFAKTGNPNSTDLMSWPTFDLQSARYLVLDTEPTMAEHYSTHRMKLWNYVVPEMIKNNMNKAYK